MGGLAAGGRLVVVVVFFHETTAHETQYHQTILSLILRGKSMPYGVLAEIEALGLDLLEVQKLTTDRESPGIG